MALAEHLALYPPAIVDRFHPARGEPGIPPLLTNVRAFGQATVSTRSSACCSPRLRKSDPARAALDLEGDSDDPPDREPATIAFSMGGELPAEARR